MDGVVDGEIASLVADASSGQRRAALRIADLLLGDDERCRAVLDQLALAAAGGSVWALDRLLTTMLADGLARPAIRRMTTTLSAIEDIEQEVLLLVARKIGTFRADSQFTTWLFRVSSNAAIAYLRRSRPAASLESDPASEVHRISSIITTKIWLRDAIAELDEAYRRPLELREYERLSYEEIADRLDLNLNTTKSRIARARAMVAHLVEHEPDPAP